MASAMPRPMSSSSVTDDTVKISVCRKDAHHSDDCSALE
jgi:hypothetical protein